MRKAILFGFGLICVACCTCPAEADVFWLGGNGIWNDPFRWASTPGGISGAGPPNLSTDAMFQDFTDSFQADFLEDGTAGAVEVRLDSAEATFNLDGNLLTLERDFFARASAAETNVTTITGGDVVARALTASAVGTGSSQRLIVDPTTLVILRRVNLGGPIPFASQLSSVGANAEILIQGTVGMDDSAHVGISEFGKVSVDGGIFSVGDRVEVDRAGTLELVNSGTASVQTALEVGIDLAGFIVLENNASLFTFGATSLGVNSGSLGNVNIDTGSRWEFRDVATVGNFGQSTVDVVGGGQLLAPDSAANLRLGAASSGSGTLTVGDGVGSQELFDSQASVFVGGTETAAGGSGELRVLATGSVNVDGQIKVWGSGHLEVLGGEVQAQQLAVINGGRLTIDNGGSIEAMTMELFPDSFSGFVDGELIVRGPGGANLFVPSRFGLGSDSGLPTIHLDNAVSFVTDWEIADSAGSAAKTIVSGQQSRLDVSSVLAIGSDTNSNGTLEVLSGGLATVSRLVTIGSSSSSVGHVVVDGSSGGQRSLLRNTAQGADDEIFIGHNGRGTLDVLNGALVQSLNNISIAAFSPAEGTVNITGSATGGTSLVSASNQIFVGGFATTENSGGTGSLNINDRGHVIAGQRLKVYADGSVTLSPGALLETPFLDTGGNIDNAGVINIGGSTLPTADGDLVVSSTGALFMFGGHLRTRNATFEAGAFFDHFAGTLEVDGGQLQLNQASVAYGSPAGFPITTFELAEGATSSVASSWRMGDDPLTFGRAVVSGAGSRLENTNVDGAADLIAGYSGTGFLEVLDGGVVDFNDDVIAALNPGSRGSLFVRGVDGNARATLRAVGGTNSDLVAGFEGDGSLSVVDGALVEAADDLFVGLVAGSEGVVTVSGSQNGFDATIRVGDVLAIGATPSGSSLVNRGLGFMEIWSGGRVEVADTTCVGPDDTLVLSGGSLHTGGLNIESNASRLAWDAGELALTASGLLVDTGGALDREITLDDDMVLSVHGSRFVGSDGVVLLEGGQFVGNDEVIIEDGGFLGGHGTVATPVFMENSGRVYPDGTLSVEGIYIQESLGELGIDIGPDSGQADLLAVTQTAQLDGLLEIFASSLLDPGARGIVDEYVLLIADQLVGSFDTVIYDDTDLTALVSSDPDGSFTIYVGQSASGDDGLFRSLNYSTATGEVSFTNYLAVGGDANGDQVVDGQDFLVWNSNKFQSGTDWTTGDFNGDGTTDGQDFLIWNSNKFTSVDLRSVPEPSCGALAALGLLLCGQFGGRRSTCLPASQNEGGVVSTASRRDM